MTTKDDAVKHLIWIAENITKQINLLSVDSEVEVVYINEKNTDRESEDYNPDGYLGYFDVRAKTD
jgi:hypothetical protein